MILTAINRHDLSALKRTWAALTGGAAQVTVYFADGASAVCYTRDDMPVLLRKLVAAF